jgi:hypothetical protein
MDATEKRVVLSIERGDFALGSAQDFLERASADAEQRIMRKPQTGVGDEFEVNQLAYRPGVRRVQIL